MYEEVKNLSEKYKELLFIKGFLLTDDPKIDLAEFPFNGNFNKTDLLGGYKIYAHKKTGVHVYKNADKAFFILGHAYAPLLNEEKESEILKILSEKYGTEEFRDMVDALTGIFVLGVIDGKTVKVETDAAGIQSCCIGKIGEYLYLSSHAQMVGDILNLEMTEFVKKLIDYKWYRRKFGPYMPADLTPFDELKRVIPNNLYTYDGEKITHKRFYPFEDLSVVKTEEEYNAVIEEMAELLKKGLPLALKKWKNPYISLTGGIDSNTTFAAANGNYDKLKTFSYISAEKEIRDSDAADIISKRFNVEHEIYNIPSDEKEIPDFDEIKNILEHNNGYITKISGNEVRKRAYLIQNFKGDVEIKSWVSESIRAYNYKYLARKKFPKLSPKLYAHLYKIFIANRSLYHKVKKIFKNYLIDFEYYNVPDIYDKTDMFATEMMWGSWGSLNISEMKSYADITILYNNRKFLKLCNRIPLEKRIDDTLHLDMKKYLNRELYDMGIRVVNMMETKKRARLLNIIFTVNMLLPF